MAEEGAMDQPAGGEEVDPSVEGPSAWPDLDAPTALGFGEEAEGSEGQEAVDLAAAEAAPGPLVEVRLGEEAMRCAVAEYLASRLLPGASVVSVETVADGWIACVSLGPIGAPDAAPTHSRVGAGQTAGGPADSGAWDEPEQVVELVEERRSRREAAHERMLAKRGGAGRLR